MRSFAFVACAVAALAGGVITFGAQQTAGEDPVAVSMRVVSAERRGSAVHGDMFIVVVNHTHDTLRALTLHLEQPASGALGEGSGVPLGDLEGEATTGATASFILDDAFVRSSEPYLVRVRYVDPSGDAVERLIVVLRTVGGRE